MDIHRTSPLDHSDWDDLLRERGGASFFHTSAWAKVIVETYGYQPVYFVRGDDRNLDFVMPFMDVDSRLTRRRGVSLPFTDHCDPYGPGAESTHEAIRAVIDHGRRSKWRYAEWRASRDLIEGEVSSASYLTHEIDLTRSESDILSGLSESHRRNLKKATRNGLTVAVERSRESLEDFYRLHCLTRRRHGLPPQSLLFFKNILEHVLSQDLGIIVSARRSGQVIASSVFFHFGPKAIFKYGASDPGALTFKPNNLVMWEAFKHYRGLGAAGMNLGRTKINQEGLKRYKMSWGASEWALKYYHYDFQRDAFVILRAPRCRPEKILSCVPVGVLRLFGRLFYKHAA
jgi:hypothetical protein